MKKNNFAILLLGIAVIITGFLIFTKTTEANIAASSAIESDCRNVTISSISHNQSYNPGDIITFNFSLDCHTLTFGFREYSAPRVYEWITQYPTKCKACLGIGGDNPSEGYGFIAYGSLTDVGGGYMRCSGEKSFEVPDIDGVTDYNRANLYTIYYDYTPPWIEWDGVEHERYLNLGNFYEHIVISNLSCSLPWGGTINHGSSITAYQASSVPCGSNCSNQTRTCNNGTLSGSYTKSFCSMETCTLLASLLVNPSSGNSPLNNVDLTATVEGTEIGTINYTFYCNRSDSGTNITSGYAAKYDGISTNPKTAADVCDYSSAGTYTAKVIIERGSLAAESRQTVTVINNPPIASDLDVVPCNYCSGNPNNIFLSWQFSDADADDTQEFYQIEVTRISDGVTAIGSKVDNDATLIPVQYINNDLAGLGYGSNFIWYDSSEQGYSWKVRVWDSQGDESLWSDINSFSTAKHRWPSIDFDWSPTNPSVNEYVQFTDQSVVHGGASKSSWSWTFQDGNPISSSVQNPINIKFTSDGSKAVTLQVTDSSGYTCSGTKNVNVQDKLPGWEEVTPW